MPRARVLAPHRAPDRPPIRIAPGDAVILGERDGEWPEFVWAVRADGLGGWVPATLFDAPSGEAVALAGYDTAELDAAPGEILELDRELAQWWWARNPRGGTGWVPARVLQLMED